MTDKLLSLAEENYKVKIKKHEFIRDTEKTKVVILFTNKGKFVLKTLFRPIERQRFILEAERHLRKKKVGVPKTILTKDKKSYFIYNNAPYVLQEWIHGSHYPLINQDRMRKIGAFLGMFHRSSLGFRSSKGSSYNGAKEWEKSYEDSIQYLRRWKAKNSKSDDEIIQSILSHIDYFIHIGEEMAKKCMSYSYFSKWRDLPLSKHYLCHGDFHTLNIFSSKGRFYLIDFEDVRYDFPSKDLNRIISYMMQYWYPDWNDNWFKIIYFAYLKQNPLTKKEKRLLFLDMAFPHIFVRYLRKKLDMAKSVEKVKKFILNEKKKTKCMLRYLKKFE